MMNYSSNQTTTISILLTRRKQFLTALSLIKYQPLTPYADTTTYVFEYVGTH